MKNFLSVVLAVFLLCSCSVDETPEETKNDPEPSVTDEKLEIFEDENGKYGLRNEKGEIIAEPIYDYIITSEESEYYSFVATVDAGTKPVIAYDEYFAPYLSEDENILNWLLDENGKPIADMAFEEFIMENHPETGEGGWLRGVAEGYSYRFEERDGVFVQTQKSGREETENEFGYTLFGYCYFWYSGYGHGLKFGDEVILEPVYKTLNMPFADRIIVYDGKYPAAGPECRVAKIIDPEGNVYSRIFNDVTFTVKEDGSYIGVAYSCGDECEVPPYYGMDYLPEGYWFIDKDGNIISERFVSLRYSFDDFDASVKAKNENGEEIEINLRDYVLES
ncbi:MAG: hypothetical protein IJ306_04405 [Oscillospiraceae bacterium]|nr:hypothetical protein [Oscillospiraceae bacterium]